MREGWCIVKRRAGRDRYHKRLTIIVKQVWCITTFTLPVSPMFSSWQRAIESHLHFVHTTCCCVSKCEIIDRIVASPSLVFPSGLRHAKQGLSSPCERAGTSWRKHGSRSILSSPIYARGVRCQSGESALVCCTIENKSPLLKQARSTIASVDVFSTWFACPKVEFEV